jgi:hypothetical protein
MVTPLRDELLNETPHTAASAICCGRVREAQRSVTQRDGGQLYTIWPITQPGETSPQSVVSSLARVEHQVLRCAPH